MPVHFCLFFFVYLFTFKWIVFVSDIPNSTIVSFGDRVTVWGQFCCHPYVVQRLIPLPSSSEFYLAAMCRLGKGWLLCPLRKEDEVQQTAADLKDAVVLLRGFQATREGRESH